MATYCNNCGWRLSPAEPYRIINGQYLGEKCCNIVTTIDDPPIHDVELFMKTFKVEDEYYSIASNNDKPTHVRGPERIYKYVLFQYNKIFWTTIAITEEAANILTATTWPSSGARFVADIVNEWHGAFKTKEGAEKELARRKAPLVLS